MSKKGKKNQGAATQQKHEKLNKEEKQEGEGKPDNKQQMTKILEAINNMDLDGKIIANVAKDYIDIKPFDEGKQILLNAIDDLHFYIELFKKGDLNKFPQPTAATEANQPASAK